MAKYEYAETTHRLVIELRDVEPTVAFDQEAADSLKNLLENDWGGVRVHSIKWKEQRVSLRP
jgi:hypothetical protein